MGSERPNPDLLLARIQAEERQRQRGKLKIFLGYVAGVGKTYAMLEAAHQRQAEGVDVVAGYIETHGRTETEMLLAGLELIARRPGGLSRRHPARNGRRCRPGPTGWLP